MVRSCRRDEAARACRGRASPDPRTSSRAARLVVVCAALATGSGGCALSHAVVTHARDAQTDTRPPELDAQTDELAALDTAPPDDAPDAVPADDVPPPDDSISVIADDVTAADASHAPDVFRTVPGDAVTLDWRGTWSLAESSLDCSDDEVAVGLVGRASNDLAALGFRCARVLDDGTLSAARNVGPRGGGGAPDFSDDCPDGQVLVRWAGAASWPVITRIVGTCASLREWLAGGATGMTLPSHGTGGTDFTDTCPAHHVARGFDYRTGVWDVTQTRVYGLRLRCVRVAP